MSHDYYELLSSGDPFALEKVHARYSRMVFWLGKGIISDDFVVESLVQDTFLKLWANRDKIESEKHLFFFLRKGMKRECYTYYTSPKHKFFRKINALESYENYQEYLAGYDPKEDVQDRKEQESQQKDFEQITKVLPLLKPERKRLIELCLKYGFQYKPIARLMGTSITDTSNEVKRAIEDIKNIINQGSQLEKVSQPTKDIKVQEEITEEQEKVLDLRLERKFSFSAIAAELKLTKEEVHKQFIAAYNYMQEKNEEQLEMA